MKSSVENLEPTKVKLTVEVPFADFKPEIDKAAKEIGKQVSVPGFRRGHVPARVLEAQFGRGALVEEAVNKSLDGYYAQAIEESGIHPMARPEVEVTQVPVEKNSTDDLVFVVTVEVRPEIVIPDPASFTVTVDAVEVSDDDVEERLTSLRERFGSLKDVERGVEGTDFATIAMVAKIGDEEIDSVSGVSYRMGTGNMVEGLDEALEGLKAGESKTFTTVLAGGEHAGEHAEVTVTVEKVQEQELPAADDEFAEMASEFDTIDELRADLREQVAKDKKTNQVYAARDELLEQLRAAVEFPLPQGVVDEEVARHLEQEGKDSDDPHAAEARVDTERMMRDQLLLDVLAEGFNVDVEQNELFNFIVEQAQAYGMDPNQFIQAAASANQLGAFAGELARGKALISFLRLVKVVDSEGADVNVVEIVGEAPEAETTPEFGGAAKAAPKVEKADDAELFDPSTKKVDEVLAYVAEADDAEKARVLEAEKSGKARKTLIEKLS